MSWWAVGAAAVSAATSLYSGISGSAAAKDAAKTEQGMERLVTQNKIEDLYKEERVLKGRTLAAVAGSNVKVGVGSPLEILNEQAAEFARERWTVSRVGATKAAQAETRGKMVGDQALYSGISSAASTAASAFAMFSASKG